MNIIETGVLEPCRASAAYLDEYLAQIRPYKVVLGTAASIILIQQLRRIWNASEQPLTTRAAAYVFRQLRCLPWIRDRIESELCETRKKILDEIHKYDQERCFVRELPVRAMHEKEIICLAKKYASMSQMEVAKGKVSGAVYTEQDEVHLELLLKVFSLYAYSNPLHPDVFPGCRKMEAEVVRMVANMYHGSSEVCGTATSGGTESIMLAMLSYRNRAYRRGISKPEMLVPITAHAAFDKAAHLFGIRIIHIPVDKNYRVKISVMKKAISRNTCVLVGSAPNFPTGTIDDIQRIADLGILYRVPVHVDACLGGFLLPFMEEAGYPLRLFDFRLEGVTSISCDTHKYGYAPKGSSVVLYRDLNYLHDQYICCPEWTGGIYATPTLAGSRCGSSISMAWTTLLYFGRDGYVQRTREIILCARRITSNIDKIEGLRLLGSPDASVIAFTSDIFNIYALVDRMTVRGWNLNSLQNPAGAHYCVTYNAVIADAWKSFTDDLRIFAAELVSDPSKGGNSNTAAIYGLAAAIPDKSLVNEVACSYLDACYAMPLSNY